MSFRDVEELIAARGVLVSYETVRRWCEMLGRAFAPGLLEARKRGILFDVGHGGAAFEFRQAVPAVKQGFLPDTISTDVHSGSINSGMKDQLNVMSKFLNMGMTLEDVILRSTWNPRASSIGSNLSIGAIADIAVLGIQKGKLAFVDCFGALSLSRIRM